MSKKTGGVAGSYVDGFFEKFDEVAAEGAKLQPKEDFRGAQYMISFASKIFAIFLSGAAAYLAARVVIQKYKENVIRWFGAQKSRIETCADLAHINLPSWAFSFMALAGPAVACILKIVRAMLLKKIDSQIPDFLTFMGHALKAGLSLPQAIEMASGELKMPLKYELSRVIVELKLGRTIDEALGVFASRVPTDDAGLFVLSVEVLRRAGGNLIETFASLAKTIEGRRRVSDRVRVLTAQGVYQGISLLLMPWILGIALYVVAPEYIEPLFGTRLGFVFIAAGILLEAAGALWLKKIVLIKI